MCRRKRRTRKTQPAACCSTVVDGRRRRAAAVFASRRSTSDWKLPVRELFSKSSAQKAYTDAERSALAAAAGTRKFRSS